jgi:hypothetical protein
MTYATSMRICDRKTVLIFARDAVQNTCLQKLTNETRDAMNPSLIHYYFVVNGNNRPRTSLSVSFLAAHRCAADDVAAPLVVATLKLVHRLPLSSGRVVTVDSQAVAVANRIPGTLAFRRRQVRTTDN